MKQHVECQKLITAECHQQIEKQIFHFPYSASYAGDNCADLRYGASKGNVPKRG